MAASPESSAVRSFWRDWRSDTWSHARAQFAWFHPVGAAGASFVLQGKQAGWSAAVDSAGALIWPAEGVVAWALIVLLWHSAASIPRMYGDRLAEIAALRLEKEAATAGPAAWRALEERFDAIEAEVRGVWSYNTVTGALDWILTAYSPESRGTVRDLIEAHRG